METLCPHCKMILHEDGDRYRCLAMLSMQNECDYDQYLVKTASTPWDIPESIENQDLKKEKFEKDMASVAQMEKRVVMAESMLEATLQYESGQVKAISSPRATKPDSPQGVPAKRTGLLSFGLGWRDRNKGKPSNLQSPRETKPADEGPDMSSTKVGANGQQE